MSIERKDWAEFQKTGLLWFVNTTLHLFGWALVLDVEEDGTVSDAYPARVPYRGFERADTEDGYARVTSYMVAHGGELLKEAVDVASVEPKRVMDPPKQDGDW